MHERASKNLLPQSTIISNSNLFMGILVHRCRSVSVVLFHSKIKITAERVKFKTVSALCVPMPHSECND